MPLTFLLYKLVCFGVFLKKKQKTLICFLMKICSRSAAEPILNKIHKVQAEVVAVSGSLVLLPAGSDQSPLCHAVYLYNF